MEINEALIAAGGTVIGTVGLEFVKRWLSKSKEKEDSASKLREELRTEVYKLREELRQADSDLDQWRTNYFELKEELLEVKYQLREALDKLESQL